VARFSFPVDITPSPLNSDHIVLNLATRFWADVRFVFRNSGKPFQKSPPVKTVPTSRRRKADGTQGVMFKRTYSPCRFSASSHSRTSVAKNESSHRRWLTTDTAKMVYASEHDRSWEDEALQDVVLSQTRRHAFPVPLNECDIFIHDESLRAASPLRSPATDCPLPRFDWRRRAASRPSQGRTHRLSCDGKEPRRHIKRLIPPHLEIQPDERFYHELKAYEDRCVLHILPEIATKLFPSRFLPLLELEQVEEEKEVRERLAKWPVKRLCDQGYCITGMSAFWLDSKFGNVATFGLGPGVVLPDNKFE